MTDRSENDLNALLELAADTPTQVDPGLMARVMADADAVLESQAAKPLDASQKESGLLRGLVAMVGGWAAVGGLVSATLAGVWIGFTPPTAFSTAANTYLGLDQTYDLGDLIASVSMNGE